MGNVDCSPPAPARPHASATPMSGRGMFCVKTVIPPVASLDARSSPRNLMSVLMLRTTSRAVSLISPPPCISRVAGPVRDLVC